MFISDSGESDDSGESCDSVESGMIKIQINPSNELQCVTANLTLHMMSKMEFQPDFWNRQILSFPNMYNTMGKKWTVWP